MRCPGEGGEPIEYTETDLVAINDTAHVRLRPGMYLGGTDVPSLHHMLFELVRCSLEEAANGHGNSVRVTLRADGSAQVEDDRIPPEQVEFLFTRVYAGAHGEFTYVIANALSAELTALARDHNSRYQHTFRRGVTHAVLQTGGPEDDRGLTVRFRPDPDVFGTATFDPNLIRERLQQYAFLISGVKITFSDEASGTREEFEYADGLAEYSRLLNAERTPLHPDVIVVEDEAEGVYFEVALQWCGTEDELRMSFANNEYTPEGGTHVAGAQAAVTRSINNFIRHHLPDERVVTGEDTRSGLTALVAVRLPDPMYYGATKRRLNNPDVEGVVATGVGNALRDYFEANPAVAEAVARKAILARDVREAVSAARRAVKKKQS